MHHISKMDVKPCSWEREPDGWRAAPNGSKRGVFVRKKGKIEHFKRLHTGHVHKGNWGNSARQGENFLPKDHLKREQKSNPIIYLYSTKPAICQEKSGGVPFFGDQRGGVQLRKSRESRPCMTLLWILKKICTIINENYDNKGTNTHEGTKKKPGT